MANDFYKTVKDRAFALEREANVPYGQDLDITRDEMGASGRFKLMRTFIREQGIRCQSLDGHTCSKGVPVPCFAVQGRRFLSDRAIDRCDQSTYQVADGSEMSAEAIRTLDEGLERDYEVLAKLRTDARRKQKAAEGLLEKLGLATEE